MVSFSTYMLLICWAGMPEKISGMPAALTISSKASRASTRAWDAAPSAHW